VRGYAWSSCTPLGLKNVQYIDLISDLAYGAAIGGALGLTGTGGSILTVPALVYLVGEGVHTAIGTSLAIVGGIAVAGAF
jgi:uncharacterized membrane protein YfcA